jgi:hypothetical protein
MTDKKSSKKTREEVESQTQSDSDNESENTETSENEEGDDDERVPIDLSENEIYRGVCTLLEDEEGNNILEYISLLHTELIGINKSMENLRLIRKEMTRIADCAELLLKGKKSDRNDKSDNTTMVEPTVEVVTKKKSKHSS